MPRNYIKVFGERAVRLVEDRLRDNLGVSETRVIADTAMKLGTSREPLRRWVMRARVDAGVRPRVSTEESAELKRLSRPVSHGITGSLNRSTTECETSC